MLIVKSNNALSSQVEIDKPKLISIISTKLNKKVADFHQLPYASSNKTIKVSFDDGTSVVVKVSIKKSRFDRIKTEVDLINKLRYSTTIPLPQVIHTDFTQQKFDYPFAIYSYLDGTNLADAISKIKDREKVGIELANTVSQIHKIKMDKPQFSIAKSKKVDRWKDVLEDICITGLSYLSREDYTHIKDIELYLKTNVNLASEPDTYSLIHRDLQPQNIHWDFRENEISGIFDFEAAMSGDKLFEFVFFELNLFKAYPEVRKSFYKQYGKHASLPNNLDEVLKFYGVIRDLIFYPRNISYGELDRASIALKSIESAVFEG